MSMIQNVKSNLSNTTCYKESGVSWVDILLHCRLFANNNNCCEL